MNKYGRGYNQFGSYANRGAYGDRGGFGYGSHNALGSYASGYRPPKSYNKGSQQAGYGTHGSYNNKKRLGSYGNPYKTYHGPGLQHLAKKPYDGYGSARYDEILGKGIVLGKYTFTDGKTYEKKDYDEVVVAGPGDKAYEEAWNIAKNNRHGQSKIYYDDDDNDYIGMDDVKYKQDITDTHALKSQIDLANAAKKAAKE